MISFRSKKKNPLSSSLKIILILSFEGGEEDIYADITSQKRNGQGARGVAWLCKCIYSSKEFKINHNMARIVISRAIFCYKSWSIIMGTRCGCAAFSSGSRIIFHVRYMCIPSFAFCKLRKTSLWGARCTLAVQRTSVRQRKCGVAYWRTRCIWIINSLIYIATHQHNMSL